jgi:hypothetical protein
MRSFSLRNARRYVVKCRPPDDAFHNPRAELLDLSSGRPQRKLSRSMVPPIISEAFDKELPRNVEDTEWISKHL